MYLICRWCDPLSAKPGLIFKCLHILTLHILNNLATYSRLRINWDKSQILPLDKIPQADHETSLPLQWVWALPNFFQYFLVGELVHAHNWLSLDKCNALVVVDAVVLSSYEALQSILERLSGPIFPYLLYASYDLGVDSIGVLHPVASHVPTSRLVE